MVKGVYTDCLLSLTTTRVRILAGVCEEVTSDFGLGGGVSSSPPVSSTTTG